VVRTRDREKSRDSEHIPSGVIYHASLSTCQYNNLQTPALKCQDWWDPKVF